MRTVACFVGALLFSGTLTDLAGAQEIGPALAPAAEPEVGPDHKTKVTFVCEVEGAVLFIDGDLAGMFPLSGPVDLTPEEHTIVVTALGYKTLKARIKVPAKAEKGYRVKMEPYALVQTAHDQCWADDCREEYPDAPYCVVEAGEELCVECLTDEHCDQGISCIENSCAGDFRFTSLASAKAATKKLNTGAALYGIATALGIASMVSMIIWSVGEDISGPWASDPTSVIHTISTLGALTLVDAATILTLRTGKAVNMEVGRPYDSLLHGVSVFTMVIATLALPASVAISIAGWKRDSWGSGEHYYYMEGGYRIGTATFGVIGIMAMFGTIALGASLGMATRKVIRRYGGSAVLAPWILPCTGGVTAGLGGQF